MANERDSDRGSFRYAPRDAAWGPSYRPSPVAHADSHPHAGAQHQYDAYAHERTRYAAHPQHQPILPRYPQHQHRSAQRDEWARTSAPASPHDAGRPSERHRSQHAAATPDHTHATPGFPSRSEWLVLPSVTQALSMYGDKRRQEPRFSLVIRQQPRRGLAVGNSQMSLRTARSIPIDPPPVCELLLDRSGDEQLLSLPEVFIRAQLVRGDSPNDECLPDARRIEPLVGDTLQSAFNSRIDTREDQSFFVFKELGVRNRGVYRLRFDLFDRVGVRIFKIASVYSDAFEVHERRKHPGLSASSVLMDALVDRGMKYKLRKASDKHAKKRKSPEDFYYGDERSVARRQSYAAGEYESRHLSSSRSPGSEASLQPVRPTPMRAYADKSEGEMLPPIGATAPPAYAHSHGYASHSAPPMNSPVGLSPPVGGMGDRPPPLPSLSRLAPQSRSYPPPQLQVPSHQSRWSQDDRALHYRTDGPRLSPLATESDRQRPSLQLRSSSSSVATSSTHNSTPNSSTTDTPQYPPKDSDRQLSALGLGIAKLDADAAAQANPGASVARFVAREAAPLPSSSSSSSSSSCSSATRPTLPPISSLYVPPPAPGSRRASGVHALSQLESPLSPPVRP